MKSKCCNSPTRWDSIDRLYLFCCRCNKEIDLCEICQGVEQEGYKLDDLNVCLGCFSSAHESK